jgi:hypothetical protein
LVKRTIAELVRLSDSIAHAAGIPIQEVQRRLRAIESANGLDQALAVLGGEYQAPVDTRRLPLADESVDVVLSSLVMQCIPIPVIPAVLAETRRILGREGIAMHRIRMTDEYATADANRNHFEYLHYSSRMWDRWFNHRLKHQNRLRASQFAGLFDEAGFDCIERRDAVDGESIPLLKETGVDESFANCDWTDLATLGMSVVLKKRTPRAATVSCKQRKVPREAASLAMERKL